MLSSFPDSAGSLWLQGLRHLKDQDAVEGTKSHDRDGAKQLKLDRKKILPWKLEHSVDMKKQRYRKKV